MVATAAGSTAYNAAAHGPIGTVKCQYITSPPINPFRPRRLNSVLLPDKA